MVQSWDALLAPGASARLLVDLHEYMNAVATPVMSEAKVSCKMLIPLSGQLLVGSAAAGGKRKLLSPGEIYRSSKSSPSRPFSVRPVSREGARFVDADSLAAQGLFDLFQVRRIVHPDLQPSLRPAGPPAHTIWMSSARESARSIEAFAHLLAASIAVQFDEAVGVVSLADKGQAQLYAYQGQAAAACGALAGDASEMKVVTALEAKCTAPSFWHLIYVRPSEPNVLPRRLASQQFDRVVYLTSAAPRQMPVKLERLLKDAARNPKEHGSPHFCAFIPSLLGPTPPTGTGYDRYLPNPGDRKPGWRIRRDSCRLRVDPKPVVAMWDQWSEARRGSFRDALLRVDPGDEGAVARTQLLHSTLDRWARAVTNRQVGVALSGGGASSYRFVPVLEKFCEREQVTGDLPGQAAVPIDLVSGVSGGALLGAYFCTRETAGLKEAVADGSWLQGALFGFVFSSRLIEQVVSWKLGRRRLADLAIRFLPVAVALPRVGKPETRVITEWMLGAAVRASGSLPLAFGPTWIGGERYADGGFGATIPAQVLKDYGADLVLALNCIAGPSIGLPFDESRLLGTVRNWLPVGSVSDLVVAAAYAMQESSRLIQYAPYVHEFVEPSPEVVPFIEMACFAAAQNIVDKASGDAPFMAGAQRCIMRWQQFRQWNTQTAGEVPQVKPLATRRKRRR